jgi:hypothetical protein
MVKEINNERHDANYVDHVVHLYNYYTCLTVAPDLIIMHIRWTRESDLQSGPVAAITHDDSEAYEYTTFGLVIDFTTFYFSPSPLYFRITISVKASLFLVYISNVSYLILEASRPSFGCVNRLHN